MDNQIEEVIDLLKEEFKGTNFSFSFNSSFQKFEVLCNNFKIYNCEEFKEVVKVIREHYFNLKFFVVFCNKV